MDALLIAMMLWLSANFDLPTVQEVPLIKYAPAAAMVSLRYENSSSTNPIGLNSDGTDTLAVYRDDAGWAAGTLAPEPDIYVRSSGDGTLTHLENWLDCIRTRKQPNAHIRVAHQAARTSHLANAALRSGHPVKWNPAAEKIETA